MKVLEAQSGILTNYEVFKHAVEQRDRYKLKKRRGPPNLETVIKEVRAAIASSSSSSAPLPSPVADHVSSQLLDYLQTKPSPLGQSPPPYTPECVPQLLERLRPYDLSKGEVVMILNLRPASIPELNTFVEDMAERFTPQQQKEIVTVVGEVLGYPDPPADQGGDDAADGDVAMGDADAAS
jgi:hypothetical protein